MRTCLLILPALLSAGLTLDAPVSDWRSPGFIASKSQRGIEMRGHVPSPAHVRRIEAVLEELGAEPDPVEFERHIVLPDWWSEITLELLPLLASMYSGEVRLTPGSVEFRGVTGPATGFRQAFLSLRSSLPANIELIDGVSVLPIDRKASICERLFASLSYEPLLFEHGVTEPRSSYHGRLNRLAAALRRCPEMRVSIAGHSDNFGTPAGNLATSRERAGSVASFLSTQGIDEDRLDVEAFGDTKPVASNATWEGRRQNRRVTISVSG